MIETGFALLLMGCLVLGVAAIAIAACESPDSHQDKVRRIEAREKQAMQEIDQTAEYHAGLYKYISKRSGDESRRRQSG